MEVTCTVTLGEDETLPDTREAVADAVLGACGGDPAKDIVHLGINVPTTTRGTAPGDKLPKP